MKTRIEVSCVEDDLSTSLFEVSKLLKALDIEFISLKVFKDRNRNSVMGHTYLTVTKSSNQTDIFELYQLKQRVAELEKHSNGHQAD